MSDILTDLTASAEEAAVVARLRRDYERRLEEQRNEIGQLRKLVGLVENVHQLRAPAPKWTRIPRSGRKHHGIATLQFSDYHFDEVVKPEQIEYANAYDRDIAVKRLRRLGDKAITLVRDYVAGLEIDGIAVLSTGDLFSGNIHEELRRTNADTLAGSLVHWIEMIESWIDSLVAEFGRLSLWAVVGNHGREPGRPIYKNRAQENVEWLFWSLLARDYRARPEVTINVGDGMDLKVPIYGTNYVITHGDEFKGGTGIAGARSPLLLGQHRTSVRQLALGNPMDFLVVGHFHQFQPPAQGLIMGGSGKGYDEYAYGKRFRPEPAQQGLWITTPEHGPTMSMPVLVQDRAAEGW